MSLLSSRDLFDWFLRLTLSFELSKRSRGFDEDMLVEGGRSVRLVFWIDLGCVNDVMKQTFIYKRELK